VHGGAVLGVARRERALVRVQTRMERQQGRVDVQQPPGVVAHEAGREDAHEAGQDHEVGGVRVDATCELGIECLAVREALVIQDLGQRCRPGAHAPGSARRPCC
jgi:hypothetical protein